MDASNLRTIKDFDYNWTIYNHYLEAQLAEESIRNIVERENKQQVFDTRVKLVAFLFAITLTTSYILEHFGVI